MLTANQIRAAQAARLERIRLLLELTVREAADMAGMSNHAWGRMERAETTIDSVGLARFGQAVRLNCGDYVLSGSLTGLPDHVIRRLVEREIREQLAAEGRTEAPPDRVRRGRPRRAGTESSEGESMPDEDSQADGHKLPPLRSAPFGW
jgi:hypothetical protein